MTEFENTKELKQNDVRLVSTKVEKGIFQKNGSSVFSVCFFLCEINSLNKCHPLCRSFAL